MHSQQHQTEEATTDYRPVSTPAEATDAPAEMSQSETERHADARTQAMALHATLSVMLRLRQEVEQRDRYDEISRAVEIAQMPILPALASADAHTRQTAVRSVFDLTRTLNEIAEKKQRVEEIMAQLLKETRKARIRRFWQNVQSIVMILGLIGAYFFIGTKIFLFWWMIFPLSGVMSAKRLALRRRDAARLLWKASEPRAVGVLAVALRDSDQAVRDTAAQGLFYLLPRVRASDAPFIDADQMNAMLAIAYRSEYDLQLPLLQALEQIGDARAIPAVRDMQLNGSPTVQKQAEACLPFLLERERRAKESVTLLRAANINATAPEELLRPAIVQDTTPPEQLLRSSTQQ